MGTSFLNSPNDAERAAAGITRRLLLKRGATGAAAASIAAMWAPSARASSGQGGTLSGVLLPRTPQLMLINRLTHGWTEEEGSKIASLAFAGYRQSYLYPSTPIDDSYLDGLLQPGLFYLDATPADIFVIDDEGLAIAYVEGLKNVEILRAIASKDQAREKMMEFWRDHFNVYGDQEGQHLLLTTWLREVLRPNALSTFDQILTSTAEGAAMLLYLDQHISSDPPNENYARELMELHTLGQVDPVTGAQNVLEADVAAAAKALTGWTLDKDYDIPTGIPTNPSTFFYYKFDANLQAAGSPGTFLGVALPTSPTPAAGQLVLSTLSNHPATAKFISYKMARWLVSYDPSPTLINNTASVFTQYGGDIRTVMTSLLSMSEMTSAGQNPAGFLLRRPFEFAVALCRALGIDFAPESVGIHIQLKRMENAPLEWPAPDGYPHNVEAWVDAVFGRWVLANKILANPTATTPDPWVDDRLPGIGIDNTALAALVQPSSTVSDVVDRIDQVLTGGIMTPNEKCVLIDFFEALAPVVDPHDVLRMTFALGASCPSFQYR